jgi:hypothetical protein
MSLPINGYMGSCGVGLMEKGGGMGVSSELGLGETMRIAIV